MAVMLGRRFLALGDPDPKNMTVIEHLEELRRRLFVCVIVAVVASLISLIFYDFMISLLIHPLKGVHNLAIGDKLIVTSITGGLFLRIKLALVPAAIICLPVWLYEFWMFIAPAFEIDTRKSVVPFVGLGLILFLIGASIGYFVFPRYFGFLVGIGGSDVAYLPDANSLLNQYAIILLLFGAVFELPIVLIMLALVNIVSSNLLRRKRKIAYFAALFGGMIITPGADPVTPLIVALLLILLYEFSIILIRFKHR
ncbi:MAG TPA: twin-arginine translocase subunit TatC [Chloroflexota bacterium]|nr:twin-arginine translocase subunit TatC [Chloroflexota bacterium]